MASNEPRLSPARGLLSPVWLGALAVLALNDHVLKGSGLLPGALTGKLSDVAGLLVAPLLLAWVLRVRTRRGLALAHVAVGTGFAAIQVSAAAAAGWAALMEGVGFPWVITSDPTDLLTLPILLVGYGLFAEALTRPVADHARDSARWTAATAGLWACAATSSPDPEPIDEPQPLPMQDPDDPEWDEPEDGWLPDLQTDTYVHNGTDEDLVVRIRPLAPEVDLDCDTIGADPARLVTADLFGLTEAWTLPAGTNQPVLPGRDGTRDCLAAWVQVDGAAPKLLWWSPGDYATQTIPGRGDLPEEPGQLALRADADDRRMWDDAPFAFDPAPADAPQCAPQPDVDRVAFAQPLPLGTWDLDALDIGPDGCAGLTLSEAGETRSWFVCLPKKMMPFSPGDRLDIRPPSFGSSTEGSYDGVSVYSIEAEGVAPRKLVITTGDGLPDLDGLELAVVPDFECEAEVQPTCGEVARPVHVSVAGDAGAAILLPGDAPSQIGNSATELLLALTHGTERFALDPSCSLGPDLLGPDLELVMVEYPL